MFWRVLTRITADSPLAGRLATVAIATAPLKAPKYCIIHPKFRKVCFALRTFTILEPTISPCPQSTTLKAMARRCSVLFWEYGLHQPGLSLSKQFDGFPCIVPCDQAGILRQGVVSRTPKCWLDHWSATYGQAILRSASFDHETAFSQGAS